MELEATPPENTTLKPGYSFSAFLTGYFVNALPSIVIQLVVIVPMLYALSRAGLFKYDFGRIDLKKSVPSDVKNKEETEEL